jgi:type I restriction enzyme S subunit
VKRYPSYKDAGVSWLGHVPAHWPLVRIGSQTALRSEKGSDKDFTPLSVTKLGVVPQLETAAKTDDGDNRKVVRKGDFVINGRSDRKGSSGVSAMDGSVSLINITIKLGVGFYPRFAHHLFRSYAFQEEFYRWGKGIVADLWSTNYWDFKRIVCAMPTLEEQEAIANYLDAELVEMNSAISSQERIIELLKERRSAIITQAVTKGLDPQAKMKDSGVPWLGHVPAHWEVKGLKFLLSANQGGAWGDEPTGLGDTIVLRSTEQTQTGEWRIEDPEVRSLSETERKKTLLKKGDILVTKASGSEAHIGKASLVDDAVASLNAGYSNFMQRLRARPGIEPQLILFMLNSKAVRDQFVYLSNSTSGLGNISASVLNNVLVAEPPESEQFGIVEHIAKECRGIDSAINKVERMIELLKERRSALITQAVTGQIDVR